MAIALVQGLTVAGGTPLVISPTTAGNFIIVFSFRGGNTSTITSITDDAGNVYTLITGSQATSALFSGNSIDAWMVPNCIGGATLITPVYSGGAPTVTWVEEWSGVNISSPIDTATSAGWTSSPPFPGGDPFSTIPINPSDPNGALSAHMNTSAALPTGTTAPWVSPAYDTNKESAYLIAPGTSGPIYPLFTSVSGVGYWMGTFVSLNSGNPPITLTLSDTATLSESPTSDPIKAVIETQSMIASYVNMIIKTIADAEDISVISEMVSVIRHLGPLDTLHIGEWLTIVKNAANPWTNI